MIYCIIIKNIPEENMKIATINQRCVWDKDEEQSFIHRGIFLCDKIEKEKPDVIGFQEITPLTLPVLKRLLPEYEFVGQFRSADYDKEGLFTAVRKETCDILGFETIWLSPTPYVAGSRFEEQSHCPRICLEAKIRHRESNTVFRLYNVHLDHVSDKARILGMGVVFDFVDSFKDGAPVVILGDFNAEPDSETIEMCGERKDLCDITSHIPVTFHGFGKRDPVKIDYIYMSNELADRVKETKAWEDSINGIYLSDHYPVCAELEV